MFSKIPYKFHTRNLCSEAQAEIAKNKSNPKEVIK